MHHSISYSLVDKTKGANKVLVNNEFYTFQYPCNSNWDCTPYSIWLPKGRFFIECWGARSGNDYYNGGMAQGGYASGYLSIHVRTHFYGFVGGYGSNGILSTVVNGGYNGGGKGSDSGSGGGGSTDLRLSTNLRSRIIVAAGAGGGEDVATGHGGGINGSTGQSTNCGGFDLITSSGPGTQISGGAAGVSTKGGIAQPGGFGFGGNGISKSNGAGGGGGGYFGGGGSTFACSGSGGSSYISGFEGCMSVIDDDRNITTSDPIHYSKMYFDSPKMIPGNNEMPLPSGIFDIGSGNNNTGSIRITIVSLFPQTCVPQRTFYFRYLLPLLSLQIMS